MGYTEGDERGRAIIGHRCFGLCYSVHSEASERTNERATASSKLRLLIHSFYTDNDVDDYFPLRPYLSLETYVAWAESEFNVITCESYEGTTIPQAYVCTKCNGERIRTSAARLSDSEHRLDAFRECSDRFGFDGLLLVTGEHRCCCTFRSLQRC